MTEVTEQEPGELALAAEFPTATRQQWQRLVAKVLDRAGDPSDAPERELATVTADGIEIAPLYVADDGRPDPG
jgi:methylmalonyl-CoA mutase